jgi:hypothetical protein
VKLFLAGVVLDEIHGRPGHVVCHFFAWQELFNFYIILVFLVAHCFPAACWGTKGTTVFAGFFVARDSTLLAVAFPIHLCFAQQWQVKKINKASFSSLGGTLGVLLAWHKEISTVLLGGRYVQPPNNVEFMHSVSVFVSYMFCELHADKELSSCSSLLSPGAFPPCNNFLYRGWRTCALIV